MRTVLRLLAVLVGFTALPVVAGLLCMDVGYGTVQCVLAALTTLPLSTVVTLGVHAGFTKAGRTVAAARYEVSSR